jgi:nitrogen regulatory protein PII
VQNLQLSEITRPRFCYAVIRPEKLNDVLESLFRADIRGLTLHRVEGHGGETERVETYRGTTVKMELEDQAAVTPVA